jgi:hypothetical protein
VASDGALAADYRRPFVPADYDEIRAENVARYGWDTAVLELLGQLYSERTHFIFELIQNAEDAGATELTFTLFADRLEVRHDGREFTVADVRAICGVGQGTKTDDLTQIGKFGIGFKAVYAYTDSPRIHSGAENFRIEKYVRPYPADALGQPAAETVFVFPFDRDEVPATVAVAEISAALGNVGVETLLFLRNIERIRTDGLAAAARVLARASAPRIGTGRSVSLSGGRRHGRGDERWFVWERLLDALGHPGQRVEIAFMAPADMDSPRLIGREPSPLVVFFPTQKETFLGFVIQGPYRTTPARDNVPERDEWNRALVRETAILLADVLTSLRDEGLLTVEVLQALPLDAAHFGPESMFRALHEQARETLEREPMIPAAGGGYRAVGQLKLAGETDLRDLLTPDLLGALYGADGASTFATEAISELQTPSLWRFLCEDAGLDEVTPQGFVARLTASYLSDRSDDWIVSFYRFLYRHPSLWQEPAHAGDLTAPARSKPIIRLEDGTHVVPFDARGRPAAYLPGHAMTEFATVRRSVARHPDALQFLTAIGFSEPDIVAEVLDHVLPRYDNADVEKLDAARHDADIELVARALDGASLASREQLAERLRQTTFLVGENAATGEQRLARPDELYQRTKALEAYFDGNPEIWLAADNYGPWLTQLRRMGVRQTVRVEARPADELGYVTIADEFARQERGVAGFDPSARIDGLEHALSNPNAVRSEFVWNTLLVPCRHLVAGVVEKSHRVEFADAQRDHLLSPIGEIARDAVWLPAPDGTFRRPADIAAADLPLSYQRDDVLAEALGMARPVLEEAGLQLGLPPDFLRRLSRYPDLVASIERELEARDDGT